MENNIFHFFATTPKGLELLLVDELRGLGAADAAEKLAGVTFTGNIALGYKACLWSRLANRILLRIQQFPATTPEELYKGVQSIAWDKHCDSNQSIYIHFVTVQSRISHTLFGAQKVKDAIVDQFREKHGVRPNVSRDKPDISIHVFLHRDVATVSIDLSGESLHKRGYRLEQGVAPLKENLAAAILLRSGWPRIAENQGSFIDPMCGAGTLVIEAALMAGNIAPGLLRNYFGFLNWKKHLPEVWSQLVEEAKNQSKPILSKMIGYDSNREVVAIAHANVERAGLRGIVHIEKRDISLCVPHSDWKPGLIVVNPPYGERLGEEAHLQTLYIQLANQFKKHFQDYRAAIFTGNPTLSKNMGLRAERYYSLFNGTIPCQLLLFTLSPEWFIDRSITAVNERRIRKAQRLLAERPDTAVQMFINRLKKNIKHKKRWAGREAITCYRIYDADLPEYAVSIDVYDQFIFVQEYQAPQSIDKDKVVQRLNSVLAVLPDVLDVVPKNIFLHSCNGEPRLSEEDLDAFYTVMENGVKLIVNLQHDGLSTGLYLDERRLRALIMKETKNKSFLSLMTESGTVNIFAALGGAAYTEAVVNSDFAV
ncbi:MAG: bifunctional 23S rRNA (guanine(2069)-N(7))-methyltransferase RlmK/23S rRNA (guanine(2445)-N(2))-methyltransferase RlmL, partial [Gammaproteobacteria bacterium]|nr:bifunctional 23S rRNA (guanine(2069)-N(7))-methyltransferase RlmK/23S rRNA (guanine(2445)-N(2))-methyltransferase RlmL [Gammaproteobacteria bacterium]